MVKQGCCITAHLPCQQVMSPGACIWTPFVVAVLIALAIVIVIELMPASWRRRHLVWGSYLRRWFYQLFIEPRPNRTAELHREDQLDRQRRSRQMRQMAHTLNENRIPVGEPQPRRVRTPMPPPPYRPGRNSVRGRGAIPMQGGRTSVPIAIARTIVVESSSSSNGNPIQENPTDRLD